MSINHFIKGGQTFSQNWRLFCAIMGKVTLVFFLCWLLSFSWLYYLNTTSYERYQLFTLLRVKPFALLYDTLDQDLDSIGLKSQQNPESTHKLTYRYRDGHTAQLTYDEIVAAVATPEFLAMIRQLLLWRSIESAVFSLIIAIIVSRLLMQYGQRLMRKKVLRGTKLSSADQLTQRIKKKHQADHTSLSELTIATIPLPHRAEVQHIWINGTTGAGKTVLFTDLLSQLRRLKRRAVIYDPMRIYTKLFYRPGIDAVLNPFDERSPRWSPWSECHRSIDYDTLAASQIPLPHSSSSEDPFWKESARTIYAATLRQLAQRDQQSIHTLLKYLVTTDLMALRELLDGTEAQPLVAEGMEKTTLSILAILNKHIKPLRFLAESKTTFSVREWIKRETDDSWLFITSRSDYQKILRPLISVWYDTAVMQAMMLPENPDRRIYFLFDEIATLQYLPALMEGLPLGRQQGMSFIFGTQDLSQLRINYGVEESNILLATANTKVILRTPSHAEMVADLFGKSEYEENTESVSFGVKDNRDGISMNKQRTVQHVILPTELQNLNNLTGYIRVPGQYPVAKIHFDYVAYKKNNPGFIPLKTPVDYLMTEDPMAINHGKRLEKALYSSDRVYQPDSEVTEKTRDETAEPLPIKQPPLEKKDANLQL